MTTSEASEYLNRTKRTLINWRKNGLLAGERQQDGSYMFTESELDLALAKAAQRYLNREVGGRPRAYN